MTEDRPKPAAANGSGQSTKWYDALVQSLLKEPKDREQLVQMLKSAQKRNLLDAEALSMIEGVLEVSKMQVRDVMIPRSQMVVVEHDAAPEAFLPTIVESAHSRFPVIGDTRDEIVGILLAKDLLAYFASLSNSNKKEKVVSKHINHYDIRDLLRPAVFIPESKRLNILLKEFRASRNHMAIVVDEYGGVAGLVTIEDVLEQIVGDIEDEHDYDDDIFIVKHSDDRFTAKAITPIDEFNAHFDTDFSDNAFGTIGGVLMHEFGRLPKRGEIIQINQFQFRILRADSRRIYLLQITIKQKNDDNSEPESVDVA